MFPFRKDWFLLVVDALCAGRILTILVLHWVCCLLGTTVSLCLLHFRQKAMEDQGMWDE